MMQLSGWKRWLPLAALGVALVASLVVVGVQARALVQARATAAASDLPVAVANDWPLAAGNRVTAYSADDAPQGCNMTAAQAANCPMFSGGAAGTQAPDAQAPDVQAPNAGDTGSAPSAGPKRFGCH